MHFGAAKYRRGYPIDLGSVATFREALRNPGTYLLCMDGHAVGLKCEAGSVFVIDSNFRNVLVAAPLAVVREIGQHDKVLLVPVGFGDPLPTRISADDAAVSAGGVQRNSVLKRPSSRVPAPLPKLHPLPVRTGVVVEGVCAVGAERSSALKRPASSHTEFGQKRGKKRALSQKPRGAGPRAVGNTGNLNGVEIPYVRVGVPSVKTRSDRVKQSTDVLQLLAATDEGIIQLLVEAGMLEDKTGHECPRCGTGRLSALNRSRFGTHSFVCRRSACRAVVRPQSGSPIFSQGHGHSSMSLQKQAVVLFSLLNNASQSLVATLYSVNHKAVERMSQAIDEVKMKYILLKEPGIVYGGGPTWVDVEADEVDLAKGIVKTSEEHDPERPVKWEQWCGVLQRGSRKSLRMFRLDPAMTVARAPGPGPIRSPEWAAIARDHLENRNVALHTDGARSYKLAVAGMVHDHVVHMKRRIRVNGRFVWSKPFFTKVYKHELPNGEILTCVGGTQTIDRFWRNVRANMRGRSPGVGTIAFERRVRAAQWDYWHKGEPMWDVFAATVKLLRSA